MAAVGGLDEDAAAATEGDSKIGGENLAGRSGRKQADETAAAIRVDYRSAVKRIGGEGHEGSAPRCNSNPERHGDADSVGPNSYVVRGGQPGYHAARVDDAGRRRSADVDLSAEDRAERSLGRRRAWRAGRNDDRGEEGPFRGAHSQAMREASSFFADGLGDGTVMLALKPSQVYFCSPKLSKARKDPDSRRWPLRWLLARRASDAALPMDGPFRSVLALLSGGTRL